MSTWKFYNRKKETLQANELRECLSNETLIKSQEITLEKVSENPPRIHEKGGRGQNAIESSAVTTEPREEVHDSPTIITGRGILIFVSIISQL